MVVGCGPSSRTGEQGPGCRWSVRLAALSSDLEALPAVAVAVAAPQSVPRCPEVAVAVAVAVTVVISSRLLARLRVPTPDRLSHPLHHRCKTPSDPILAYPSRSPAVQQSCPGTRPLAPAQPELKPRNRFIGPSVTPSCSTRSHRPVASPPYHTELVTPWRIWPGFAR